MLTSTFSICTPYRAQLALVLNVKLADLPHPGKLSCWSLAVLLLVLPRMYLSMG